MEHIRALHALHAPRTESASMVGFRDAPRRRQHGYCRSCLPIAITFVLFTGLLATLGLLAHFRSPARQQQLGWQSWDLVQEGGGDAATSLPLDVWDPLLPHKTGRECSQKGAPNAVTEITVSSCYLPPALFPTYCRPKSSGADDKLKGKWVLVDKDLNERTGLW